MFTRPSVFIIDGDSHARRQLARVIRGSGYRVDGAGEAREALQLMYRMHPDLVVLAQTPKTDETWEILARIRALTDTPVILLGCQAGPERSRDHGATVCLREGASAAALLRQIETLLAEGRQEPSSPECQAPVVESVPIPLQFLTPAEVLEIDRAVAKVRGEGEVQLIKTQGSLAFIASILTEDWESLPEQVTGRS